MLFCQHALGLGRNRLHVLTSLVWTVVMSVQFSYLHGAVSLCTECVAPSSWSGIWLEIVQLSSQHLCCTSQNLVLAVVCGGGARGAFFHCTKHASLGSGLPQVRQEILRDKTVKRSPLWSTMNHGISSRTICWYICARKLKYCSKHYLQV